MIKFNKHAVESFFNILVPLMQNRKHQLDIFILKRKKSIHSQKKTNAYTHMSDFFCHLKNVPTKHSKIVPVALKFNISKTIKERRMKPIV